MPITALNDPEYYLRSIIETKRMEEAEKEKRNEQMMTGIAGIAQAYQDFSARKGERQMFNQFNGGGSRLEQARQGAGGPGIDMPVDPGGGINFLNPQALAYQNQGRNLPVSGSMPMPMPQPAGFLSRMRQDASDGRPLNSVERMILDQQIKTLYGDPYGKEQAQANYYNSRAGSGTGQLPPGFILVNGKAVKDPVYAASMKPPTQGQESTALYASRIKQSNKVFDDLEKYTHNLPVVGTAINEWSPNFLKSDDFQSYEQAQRNFLNAVLRRESGAVISPTEFSEGKKQYFPQPGDSKKVLAQKKATRDLVMKNFIKSSGKAYVPYEEAESGGGNDPLGLR